jgi:uncharacterized membrane protein YedE/YeeE
MMGAASFLVVLVSGALFGGGLALSTMIQPEVVLAFLRFQDLGLLLVLGGATTLTLLAYQFGPRLLRRPPFGKEFQVRKGSLDRKTVGGAAIFGAGWGLSGVCPGPAIAGLGAGNWPLLWALVGIAAGAWLQGRLVSPVEGISTREGTPPAGSGTPVDPVGGASPRRA